jgi:Flp pilus assembly protein TadG
MWRLNQKSDDGAIALLVAILLGGGVLMGMAALSVDVGRLQSERRQVQNGADSASLALAKQCAATTTCDASLAVGHTGRDMANPNANDGQTRLTRICGVGPGLAACPAQTGVVLGQCPPVPAGMANWVRVNTATAQVGGGTLLPYAFAQTLTGAPDGKTVSACAQSAWGTPSSMGALPVTLSQCEWDAATAGGTAFPAQPPYPPYPPAAKETKLVLHSPTEGGGSCPTGYSGGAYFDLPGGFGWLDGGGSCQITTAVGSTVHSDTGASSSTCSDVITANVGKILYLPIYSSASKTGKTYTIAGYAAFYVTGYTLPAAHPKKVPSPIHGNWCTGSDQCIYGFFTKALVPSSGVVGTGPSFGASVLGLIG